MFVYQHPVHGEIQMPEPTAEELKIARYIANDQFMSEAWCRGFDYHSYVMHATRLQYHVFTEAEYQRWCDAQNAQMEAYFAEKDSHA